jgi:hypothetical protein
VYRRTQRPNLIDERVGAGEGNRTLVFSLEGIRLFELFQAYSDKRARFEPIERKSIIGAVRTICAHPVAALSQSIKEAWRPQASLPAIALPRSPGNSRQAPVGSVLAIPRPTPSRGDKKRARRHLNAGGLRKADLRSGKTAPQIVEMHLRGRDQKCNAVRKGRSVIASRVLPG